MLVTIYEFYHDDITVTSFIDKKFRSGFSISNQIKFDLRFTDLRST